MINLTEYPIIVFFSVVIFKINDLIKGCLTYQVINSRSFHWEKNYVKLD